MKKGTFSPELEKRIEEVAITGQNLLKSFDVFRGTGKLVAIHCTKCGILVGYRRYDVDILCVNCGQTLLSEKGK